jgi:hypothetical protein
MGWVRIPSIRAAVIRPATLCRPTSASRSVSARDHSARLKTRRSITKSSKSTPCAAYHSYKSPRRCNEKRSVVCACWRRFLSAYRRAITGGSPVAKSISVGSRSPVAYTTRSTPNRLARFRGLFAPRWISAAAIRGRGVVDKFGRLVRWGSPDHRRRLLTAQAVNRLRQILSGQIRHTCKIVVVPAADGAELLARLGEQGPPMLRRHGVPGRVGE